MCGDQFCDTEYSNNKTGPASPKWTLSVQIIIAVIIGLSAGIILGPAAKPAGVAGTAIIKVIKTIAIPLVFLAIIDSLASVSISLRQVKDLLGVTITNSVLAASLGVGLAELFQPGTHFKLESGLASTYQLDSFKPVDFGLSDVLGSIIPTDPITPFIQGSVIQVVVLALASGVLLRWLIDSSAGGAKVKSGAVKVRTAASTLLVLTTKLLGWILHLVPLAVLAVTASVVGEHGFAPFKALTWYVAVIAVGLIIHPSVVYHLWITCCARMRVRGFWKAARDPVIHAFATNSSLATLPLTLAALDRIGVPKSASRLGACVGTNLNNDGILLYEAGAALFVAQASGIDLSLAEQATVIGLSLVAAVGVAGVPEAGIVSLSMVLTAVGLPLEILPILLTVDWIIARLRSVVNVLSDLTVSIVLGEFEKRQQIIAEEITK